LDRNKFAFALQSGATDVIGKPIPPAALSWRVWQLLKRRGFLHPAERAAQRSAMDEASDAPGPTRP
ncbi:MAG TPA: hypothetical protein VGR00_01240, partial [Thermoanaerobaculia bacterium]|nr:hypothetical protein [Thermoanaerobaculia bacterium]